jgi:hypothetical protein
MASNPENTLIFQKQGHTDFLVVRAYGDCDVGTINMFSIHQGAAPRDGGSERNGVSQQPTMTKVIFIDHPFQQTVATNIMYAADGDIFLHVGGDRMSSLTLSGYGFASFCELSAEKAGFKQVVDWYHNNRVSRLNANDPLKITIAAHVLEGYLVGFTSKMEDVSVSLVSFTMSLHITPDVESLKKGV